MQPQLRWKRSKHSWIAAMVALLMMLGFLKAPVARAQDAQGAAAQRLSPAQIPNDAMVSGFVSVRELLAAPELKLMPTEVASAWMVENVGLKLEQIDSVKVVVGTPGPQGVEFGVVVNLADDFDLSQLNQQLVAGPAESVGGYQAIPLAQTPNLYAHQLDARTVMVATPGYVEKMIAAKEPTGPLATLVARLPRISPIMIAMAMEPIRAQVNQAAAQAGGQLPPPIRDLTELPNLLDGIVMAGGISRGDKYRLMMVATDEDAAVEAEKIVNNAIRFRRDLALVQATQGVRGNGPVPEATRAYFQRLADEVTVMITPRRTDNRLMIEVENTGGMATGMMMMGMFGAGVPNFQIANVKGRDQQASNNLKQLMLAMHNYHSVFNHFPEAVSRGDDGEPLLSWRVAILPFIEEQALYEQFRMDEPWDSEHNIKLLEQMPAVYSHPGANTEPGMTVYQVPVGEDLAFPADGSISLREVTDGTSNTIAIVETDVASAVPWTKPEDVKIDLEDPLAHMGKAQAGGFMVAFMDGSVQFIRDTIDQGVFRALLTRAGGEAVQRP